ncbi:type II TA system antitoxin MqsA family protein [Thiomicrorhabdus marina]|uniref:type II TA system antitoxin MqsA family protein n=1 Tax=Thiomicrorhabdus marina TaxID=2818442 RepID=UPI003133390E
MIFKKHVDSLLSAEEIRRMREAWGIDQKQAAAIFGGGPVAFSKYENNDVMQSEGMDKLLRAAWYAPDVFEWLKEKAGIEQAIDNHAYQKTVTTQFKSKPTLKVLQTSNIQSIFRRTFALRKPRCSF